MSELTLSHRPRLIDRIRTHGWRLSIGAALVIFGVISKMILDANPQISPRFRLSLEPVLAAPPLVQVHIVGALSAFVIGVVLLLKPKGVGLHKTLGWAWIVAMLVTAGSSFFLTGLMGSSFSPIHALSAWTMISLPFGIAAIRRRDVKRHAQTMTGMFLGAMVIAGLFTFLPGRLMWQIFFAV